MCFYARTDFSCGDWKWGNMMIRCPLQHRMGETCGRKFLALEHLMTDPEPCKICREIEVKLRRCQRLQDNITRWEREGSKFSASLERAVADLIELRSKLVELQNSRPLKRITKDSGERPGSGQTIPGIASFSQIPQQEPEQPLLPPTVVSPNGSYEYSSNRNRSSAAAAYSGVANVQRLQPLQTLAMRPVQTQQYQAQRRR